MSISKCSNGRGCSWCMHRQASCCSTPKENRLGVNLHEGQLRDAYACHRPGLYSQWGHHRPSKDVH